MTSEATTGIVVLAGNPRPGSRTAATATALAGTLSLERPGPGRTVDLALLAPDLVTGNGEVPAALHTVRSAPVLVVATPVDNGNHTGLLKAFLDLLPGRALAGTVAVPATVAATAGATGSTR